MKKITILLCAALSLNVSTPIFCFCEQGTQVSLNTTNAFSSIHSLTKVSKEGTLIAIEDGSQWAIADSDAPVALKWSGNDPLIISLNPYYFSFYTYCIHNLNTNDKVLANLYYGPEINGSFTKQVASLDDREVILKDGSCWLVASKDQKALSRWREDDHVIIGNNFDRNILINVELNKYIEVINYN